jgi:hypothetical protein
MPGRDRRGLATATALVALITLAQACGSALPARYVIEHDLGAYAFRRYQKSLDIEVPIPDNPATGHTAVYLHRAGRDDVTVITAFVTVYARAQALASEARAALSSLAAYSLTNSERSGEYVWLLTGASQERWCVWVSNNRLVKIGAPANSEFPGEVIEAYLAFYPSDLGEHGAARANAPSTGEASVAPPLHEVRVAHAEH